MKHVWIELPRAALEEDVTIASIIPKRDLLMALLKSIDSEESGKS